MSFIRKVWTIFTRPAEPSFENKAAFDKIFICFAVSWFFFWSILPLISLNNEFIDGLENIVWGSHFQFGYDKNPYLGAWVGYAGWLLTGKSLWFNSVFSQIFVFAGFCSVYALAKKMLSPSLALLSVLSLAAINFYGMKSVEFCDDVMELGLWPLTILFFYRALTRGNRLSDWLATGFFLACSAMVKYYVLVIMIPMAFILLFTRKGRSAWKTPSLYCAAALGVVISLPNLIWLCRNDMVAVDYALGRASLGGGGVEWSRHLTMPLKAINRALGVVIVPFGFMLPLFFPRPAKRGSTDEEKFDRLFLTCFAAGPMGITLLFSLFTGASINYSWVVPCFPFLPLLVIHIFRPAMNPARMRFFLTCVIGFGLLFGIIFSVRSLWWQGYSKRGCDYENFPGKAISAIVTDEWRRTYRTPLPYVIGDREEACNLAVYSPDFPEAYFSANRQFSQWIREEDIREKGAALLWEGSAWDKPEFLKRFSAPDWQVTEPVTVQVPRAVPPWFRSLVGRTPKTLELTYCFIRPSSGGPSAAPAPEKH